MSPDTARLIDEVSIMKYICKEFWISLYMKQIDNLRTNNQGIFVLQDNNFRFLTHMSAGKQYIDVTERVSVNLMFKNTLFKNFSILFFLFQVSCIQLWCFKRCTYQSRIPVCSYS